MPSARPVPAVAGHLPIMFLIVVGIFAAYIAGRTLRPGTPTWAFHIVSATAFIACSLALCDPSTWYRRAWS